MDQAYGRGNPRGLILPWLAVLISTACPFRNGGRAVDGARHSYSTDRQAPAALSGNRYLLIRSSSALTEAVGSVSVQGDGPEVSGNPGPPDERQRDGAQAPADLPPDPSHGSVMPATAPDGTAPPCIGPGGVSSPFACVPGSGGGVCR